MSLSRRNDHGLKGNKCRGRGQEATDDLQSRKGLFYDWGRLGKACDTVCARRNPGKNVEVGGHITMAKRKAWESGRCAP